MNKIIVSILLLFLSFASLQAQNNKTIKLKDINGVAIGGINTSPAQVISDAIQKAKLEALSKAGIHEEINTYQNFYKSETDEEYEEVFTSDIFTNIRGVVSSITVKDTISKYDPKTYSLTIEVTIDVNVLKYNKKEDRTFDAWITGVKPFYNNNEALSFKIKPTKDCYLRVFIIARQQESYVLFPNEYEKDFKLEGNVQYTFPNKNFEYLMQTKITQEPHRIILVLIKEPIPYTEKVAYKPILDWIFSISPNKRIIKTFGYSVIKN